MSEIKPTRRISQPLWITVLLQVISPVTLASGVFYLGSLIKTIEQTTFSTPEEKAKVIDHVTNKYHIQQYEAVQMKAHIVDKDAHMPLKEKQEMFVTRKEYEITMKNIEKTLQEIKADNKEIKQDIKHIKRWD